MAKRNLDQKPKFFWQGALILLPVAVLAIVGLIALRQDERAAELDARNRAAENARSLGLAVGLSVNDDLKRFMAFQSASMTNPLNLIAAGMTVADPALTAAAAKWDRDYPGLNLADSVTVAASILTDGRQVNPPGLPAVPAPPKWFLELSPRQKDDWKALRSADNPAEVESREQTFLADNPSADACLAAHYVTNPPEQLWEGSRLLATESGISFQDVACYRMLSATNARLSDSILKFLFVQTVVFPSFVAPKLVEMAEGLTNRADALTCQKFSFIQWARSQQSRASAWLESIRQWPELRVWKSQSRSRWTADDEALAVINPTKTVLSQLTLDGESLSGQGYQVWFIPRGVVEAVFNRALALNKFLIPEYASAAISVEGIPMRAQEAVSDNAPEILGRAAQTVGNDSVTQDAIHFDLSFYLTNKEQMLAGGHRRARLFGGLIVGAVFAAFAGLVSARRAFYRQLRVNEMKSNFVSSVSHELRAPIASVRLMAENLERGKIPETPRQHEYFRFIVQECRRLSSLIENVLDFSRIEQGRKEYEFEAVDVIGLAQTTVKLMETSATEKDVKLEFSVRPPGVSQIEINVDGRAIQQALVNLIDNAIKHSPKGETVTVGVEVQGRNWRIEDTRRPAGFAVRLSTAGLEDKPLTAESNPLNSLSSTPVEERAGVRRRFLSKGCPADECYGKPEPTLHEPSNKKEPPHPVPSPPQVCGGEGAEAKSAARQRRPTRGGEGVEGRAVLCLFVSDHGPGIPAAEHGKIFERFYRLGSELRRDTQGVGIGLSVVEHIVTAHGGRIVVESEPGKGSRFTIELPVNMRDQNE